MYFLSNAFTVASFFIFLNFLYHPNVDMGDLGGHAVAAAGTVSAVIMCQIIIVVFAVLFVGYSNSIFIKARGKEFGLLSLYGMTKSQIKKYVFIENTIISILSIIAGIVFGGIFSKLFLMTMENLIDVRLPFNLSIMAIGITVGVFLLIFEIISYFMLINIKDKEIVEQLKAAKIPKELRPFSKKKAIAGIVLLILAYTLAWFASGAMVVLLMIPVTTITIIATKLFFTESSIYIGNRLSKSDRFMYDKNNLVVVSQLVYKLQDTAKVLFLASILGAVTFTATETIYSFYTETPMIIGFDGPQDVAILRDGDNLNDQEIVGKVKSRIEGSGSKIKDEKSFDLLKGRNLLAAENEDLRDKWVKEDILIISNSDFNTLDQFEKPFQLERGQVVYNFPHRVQAFSGSIEEHSKLGTDKVILQVGNNEQEYKVAKEIFGKNLSNIRVGYPDLFVVNDEDFKDLYEGSDETSQAKYDGFELKRDKRSYGVSKELIEEYSGAYEGKIFFKIIPFVNETKAFGMILFIGFFISFIFFIGTGSIIYFKLFNEVNNDRREYDIMRKIGTTNREIKRIVTKQIGIVFFLPFIISIVHSFFALKSLANLLQANLLLNGITIMIVYGVFQLIYFVIIRKIYLNKVMAK